MLPTLKLQFYKKQKQKETLDIKSSVQCSVFRFFSLSSTFCLNSIIPNITPRGLFLVVVVVGGGGGGAYIWKEFSASKICSPRGLYTVELIIRILRYCKIKAVHGINQVSFIFLFLFTKQPTHLKGKQKPLSVGIV